MIVGKGIGPIETAVLFGDQLPQVQDLLGPSSLDRLTPARVGQGEAGIAVDGLPATRAR